MGGAVGPSGVEPGGVEEADVFQEPGDFEHSREEDSTVLCLFFPRVPNTSRDAAVWAAHFHFELEVRKQVLTDVQVRAGTYSARCLR